MFDKYTIQSGDSLDSIARQFCTSVEEIQSINNIDFSLLRAGTEIIVPKLKEKYFEYYTIEKGDNLYRIALKYNVNPELLSNLNGLNMSDYIYPGQELLIPKAGYSYYITTEGDTLEIVANRFKNSKEAIIDQNETIYLLPGQMLVNKRN